MAECVFQSAIEHMNTYVEKPLDGVPVPSHLLLLHHAFRDDFIDRGLDKSSGDPLTGAVPLTVIGHGICVQFQLAYHLQERLP